MDEPSSRRAARRVRPPSWRDPRLVVGVLLVLGASAAGSLAAARADRTVPVLVAARTLVTGDEVTAGDVRPARARLGAATDAYLPAAEPLPAGVVVLRTVTAGELLPRSALGSAEELATRPVAVPLDGPPPRGVVPGAQVDVWVVGRPAAAEDVTAPRRVAAAVEVHAVGEPVSGVGRGAVEVLLEPGAVAAVLGALAADDRVDVVLVPGSSPER